MAGRLHLLLDGRRRALRRRRAGSVFPAHRRLVHEGRTGYIRAQDEARADVFNYMERFYNRRRRHSKPGYLSLMEFEARAMRA